LLRGFFIFVP